MLLLGTGLLFGVLGSLHCLGMCAPILWAVPQKQSKRQLWWKNRFFYNIGRASTYALLGALIGLLGEGISFAGFQQKISIATGVLILLLLFTTNGVVLTRFRNKKIISFMRLVRSKIGELISKNSPWAHLRLGIWNGFLPCGLVYMALLASVSMGSILGGALYMFIFGLGTFPMMLAAAFFGSHLKSLKPAIFSKLVPFTIAIISILLIIRGMGLGIPFLSPETIGSVEVTLCLTP